MGKFVYKVPIEPPAHQHDYPVYEYNARGVISKGDIWKCGCGLYFQISKVDNNSLICWRVMWPEELSEYNL
jgi:hypothetical protein